jgi:hypothetical protein
MATTQDQYLLMGFEGKIYVGPAGCTSPTESGMMLADSIRNPKYSWKYSDVDATLRRHNGVKAFIKGMLEVGINFTLPNLKNTDGTRPSDVALMLQSLKERRCPITIIMIDEEDGEGIIGDFELFGGDKSEEDENLQAWDIEAKPSAAGRKVDWYAPE